MARPSYSQMQAPQQINANLDKIAQLALQLNQMADAATTLAAQIEHRFEVANVGNVESIRVEISDDDVIVYKKHGNKYRLVAEDKKCKDDDNNAELMSAPLAECSRDVRIKAYHKLPLLVNKIAETLQALVSDKYEPPVE